MKKGAKGMADIYAEEPEEKTEILSVSGKKEISSRVKNAKITSIYLDTELHEELRKLSFVHKVTQTSIIERALRHYLKDHKF